MVDRDFGFAPNPFHGVCTLATCKPPIRRTAHINDWVIGVGGRRLKATGRCIFAMRVTQILTFNEYWEDPAFLDKRPVRNGSRVMMLGDNIYHREQPAQPWQQLDSHHSLPDGSPNPLNIAKDTKVDRVLISREFYYFGSAAPVVPGHLLDNLGYSNHIGYRVFSAQNCADLLAWIQEHRMAANSLVDDPFDFQRSAKRYSGRASLLL